MTDQAIPGPTPSLPLPESDWDKSNTLKKMAWGLGKLGVSVSAAPSLAPAAAAAIQKLSAITTPYGVSLSVDQVVFEKALPFLIFGVLAAGLDYAKVKTKLPWL